MVGGGPAPPRSRTVMGPRGPPLLLLLQEVCQAPVQHSERLLGCGWLVWLLLQEGHPCQGQVAVGQAGGHVHATRQPQALLLLALPLPNHDSSAQRFSK